MATERYPDAKADNSVYQDGEGCLYVACEGHWHAFGSAEEITDDNPLVVHPLTLVFDNRGNAVVTKLNYL